MKKSLRRYLLILVVFWGGSLPGSVQAQVFPNIALEPRLSGLQSPVAITHAGDGSGRLFIVEQTGTIRIFQNDALIGSPFLDISARVLFNGEQGLLGLAFPPNYAGKRYFYVYYTNLNGDNVLGALCLVR